MRGVNRATILGHLGNDPEVSQLPSGKAVVNFSVATSEQWKDQQTGEQKEATEWHRVTAFGRLAEICGQYLQKGKQVYIEGKIKTRKWQDRDGNDRYTTEIIANEMQMLGSKGDSAPQRNQPAAQPEPVPQADFDDSIPFAVLLPGLLTLVALGSELASTGVV